jgi:Domain of unknown function (DUF4397)/LPXTG cell wall anchor motif
VFPTPNATGRRFGVAGKLTRTTVIAALLVWLVLATPALAQEQKAMLRVAHLSPDAANADIHINGEPVAALSNMPFKAISEYLPVSAGTQSIEIYPAGDPSGPLVETKVGLLSGEAYTVAVVGLAEDGTLETQVYEDDRSLPADDQTRLRVIHAAPDVDAVDISSRGVEDVFADLGFPNATDYSEVPVGTYTLEAQGVGTDEEAFFVPDATFMGGTVYSVFAVGQAKDGTLEMVVAEDAGASGSGRQTTRLEVVPVTAAPTGAVDELPDTGGLSPALLLFAALASVATGSVLAVHARRKLDSAPAQDQEEVVSDSQERGY